MPGYWPSAFGAATKVRIGKPCRAMSTYSVLTIICLFARNSDGGARASQLPDYRPPHEYLHQPVSVFTAREISPVSRSPVRPIPYTFWSLLCLLFASRPGLCLGRYSSVPGWEQYHHAAPNPAQLAAAADSRDYRGLSRLGLPVDPSVFPFPQVLWNCPIGLAHQLRKALSSSRGLSPRPVHGRMREPDCLAHQPAPPLLFDGNGAGPSWQRFCQFLRHLNQSQ